MARININGFSIQKDSGTLINATNVSYKKPVEYYFWDLWNIPQRAGVYVVYDVLGDCLYVGSTPYRYNLNKRISEHLRKASFRNHGHKIIFYETDEDTTDILLLEKIFTKALDNPPFNKERKNAPLSATGVAYLKKYKVIRSYPNWNNTSEREARNASVPMLIVALRDKIEDKYNFLEDLPLRNGEVNLPSLFDNMKKFLKKAKKKKPSATFEDLIDEIIYGIDQDKLSNETITRIVLNNKQYIRYKKEMRKKK
ncbi:GIY-YIG nuclease family protein [Neobacillus mesonae]|uniref:GIY-YIG nuclease family protein n=1 Tax=Neobacillus mesonae TaxID=1193713 RepID=UPI00203FB575|nr:GIY-YIG nuclease family protein [Neobacillus mesonae]MCM3571498.1 GIY-YIG nuclease family protein [Neobacillus mesonae]